MSLQEKMDAIHRLRFAHTKLGGMLFAIRDRLAGAEATESRIPSDRRSPQMSRPVRLAIQEKVDVVLATANTPNQQHVAASVRCSTANRTISVKLTVAGYSKSQAYFRLDPLRYDVDSNAVTYQIGEFILNPVYATPSASEIQRKEKRYCQMKRQLSDLLKTTRLAIDVLESDDYRLTSSHDKAIRRAASIAYLATTVASSIRGIVISIIKGRDDTNPIKADKKYSSGSGVDQYVVTDDEIVSAAKYDDLYSELELVAHSRLVVTNSNILELVTDISDVHIGSSSSAFSYTLRVVVAVVKSCGQNASEQWFSCRAAVEPDADLHPEMTRLQWENNLRKIFSLRKSIEACESKYGDYLSNPAPGGK